MESPGKPWPKFPLTWHSRGHWQKKVDGEIWRFGADPIKAYDEFKDRLKQYEKGESSGAVSKVKHTLDDAKNLFLTKQERRLNEGEIGAGQMGRYYQELREELPKAISMSTRLSEFADDRTAPALFEKIRNTAMARGLYAAEKHVVYVKAMLDYAASASGGRLMRLPVYGDAFNKPTNNQITMALNKKRDAGDTIWTQAEAVRILNAAKARSVHLYAQLMLCAIAAYTSADVAALPLGRIKREDGVIDFPRVKNGRKRRCALVPALIDAIDASLADRPDPAEPAFENLVFLSRKGTPISENKEKVNANGSVIGTGRKDNLNIAMKRLCESLDRSSHAGNKPKGFIGPVPMPLRRKGCGQSAFRSLNYTACITANVDSNYHSILRGRRLAVSIEEHYLRGKVPEDFRKLIDHIVTFFGQDKPAGETGAAK